MDDYSYAMAFNKFMRYLQPPCLCHVISQSASGVNAVTRCYRDLYLIASSEGDAWLSPVCTYSRES